jgi:hypothetical protein
MRWSQFKCWSKRLPRKSLRDTPHSLQRGMSRNMCLFTCPGSVERHAGFPDFPNFADEIRPRLERQLAGLPSRGRGFGAFAVADMLEGLDLAEALADVSSHRRGQDLKSLDDAVGIDNESPPRLDPRILQVHPVDGTHFSPAV